MLVSIFNDVVGPVMRGPSSSHCAAALRIGRLARNLMKGRIERVEVEFDTGGSLPATHASQGSDMGLFGGLLGFDADDDRLPEAESHLKQAGIDLRFQYKELGDPHPNTYRLRLFDEETSRTLVAISVGGGMIEVIEIDQTPVSIGGDYDETLVWLKTPDALSLSPEALADQLNLDEVQVHQAGDRVMVQLRGQRCLDATDLHSAFASDDMTRIDRLEAVLPVRSRAGIELPFQTCNEMLEPEVNRERSLSELAIEYEKARSGLDEDALVGKMQDILAIVRRSVHAGLQGTQYEDRVLGFQSGGFQQSMQAGRLIEAGLLNEAILRTTALMEVKSSLGVIVAAPTAGACAAFPAICLAAAEKLDVDDATVARAMLAGGVIGVFIATHWSFAAEVGGCQAEGGSAAAMSAAALVDLMGGTASQATGAASMALQNMLGLICDPVANRVEVPCLGKNVLAASNAIACANMTLAGFDAVIPMDETIAAARAVSERMPREHRCTALGGLAMTPTSKAIQQRLESGCGGCQSHGPVPLTAAPRSS